MKSFTSEEVQRLEGALLHDCRAAIAEFRQTLRNKDVYVFVFDCDFDQGIIVLTARHTPVRHS